jgi:hypothetical protein
VEQLNEALAYLESADLAHRKVDPATGGRTAERWYPGRSEDGNYTPSSLSYAETTTSE